MITPHTSFREAGASSLFLSCETQRDASVCVIESAAVQNERIKVTITTGIRTIPIRNGRCCKNPHTAAVALFSFRIVTKSTTPFICQFRAVPPHTENHTRPKTEGNIQLIIINSRIVLP